MEFFVLLVIITYLVPSIVAGVRGHRNSTAITVLNVFTGWSGIGWLGCLVWALINGSDKK